MSSENNYWFRLFFKLMIYERSGESFQRLVNDLFQHHYVGFQAISPWGSWGDGGNDGWIPTDLHYFQVYGPRPTTKWEPLGAVNKVIEDFDKICEKWGEIHNYSFVLNDRFCGIPAPVSAALKNLKDEKQLLSTACIGSRELEGVFMPLADDIKQNIVGGIPARSPEFLDHNVVGELLSNLADSMDNLPALLTNPEAPDFNKKIAFNGISKPVSDYLVTSSYHVSEVDAFLSRREAGLEQAIAEEIRRLYQESKEEVPNEDEDASNLRYAWMLDKLIPDTARKHPHSMKAYRQAAQTIIAKFFETCDAYDHPSSNPTT